MRALIQGLVAPRRPAVNRDVTLCWVVGAVHTQAREGGRAHVKIFDGRKLELHRMQSGFQHPAYLVLIQHIVA